jgi:hypothetical protein
MGYEKPFIPLKVTAKFNILNHTPMYSTSHLVSIIVYHHPGSQSISINGSPPKTVNVPA